MLVNIIQKVCKNNSENLESQVS